MKLTALRNKLLLCVFRSPVSLVLVVTNKVYISAYLDIGVYELSTFSELFLGLLCSCVGHAVSECLE